MDKLLAQLAQHPSVKSELPEATDAEDHLPRSLEHQSSSSSLPITPATDTFAPTAPTTRSASTTPNEGKMATEEVLRLKLELAQAQNKISRLDHELAQSRLAGQASGRATPAVTSDLDIVPGIGSPGTSRGPTHTYQPMPKAPIVGDNAWIQQQDDCRSDVSDSVPSVSLGRGRPGWNNNKPGFQNVYPQGASHGSDGQHTVPWPNNRNNSFGDACYAPPATIDHYRSDRMTPDHEVMRPSAGRRGSRYDNRFGTNPGYASGYPGYNTAPGQYESSSAYAGGAPGALPGGGAGMNIYTGYPQQPVGTPLSPHATEFTAAGAPWKAEVRINHALQTVSPVLTRFPGQPMNSEGQTYLPATEPLNYRRLLDRNVTCDWKYIVDKIVCNNDQQASIFLQQKLKVGTPEQMYDIVEAIVAQAYPLMVNRFGNFLVQRCFEHGTPEQVIKIATAIRGNTLNLSMDPFGCHVVQKAFDSVPEDYKAVMVCELLRRIPETVIHRYACHVWQKLFELRWTESPPQIMKYVNEALRGMWHEVALGETGSLVVQNIFENCLEEDKVCQILSSLSRVQGR